MEETIFSKIIRREVSADIVYEDEYTLAFLDIHPNNAGHTLVVPKKQVRNLLDMDTETLGHLMETVQKVAKAVKEAVQAGGFNIIMNNEPAAGQVIFHAHIHIIPRYEGDGFKFFPHKEYAPGESTMVADKIRLQLQ